MEGDLSREDEARLIEELDNARDEIKNIKMRQASLLFSLPPGAHQSLRLEPPGSAFGDWWWFMAKHVLHAAALETYVHTAEAPSLVSLHPESGNSI